MNTVASPPSPAPAPALPPAASSDGWPPFAVAALRALLSAVLVGGTTFLATYTRTSDAKTLAIATMTAVLGVLTARLGAEGVVDQARANRGGT